MAYDRHIEYESIGKLQRSERTFVKIPERLIADSSADQRRLSVYSFFAVNRGIDGRIMFDVNEMAEWIGRKPNGARGGTNDKIRDTISYMQDSGYISVDGVPKNASMTRADFDIDFVDEICNEEYFAIVYVDEIYRIFEGGSDGTLPNVDILLLILAYLRLHIPRRNNVLRTDEVNIDDKNNHEYDVRKRRERYPESFNAHFKDIAVDIGVSERIVSKYVNALMDMKIIYFEPMPRFQYEGKWHTDYNLFCNWYKRDGLDLIANGKKYYSQEILNKKAMLGRSRKKTKRKQQ